MNRTAPVSPVDREQPFGAHELFFSTTDRKAIIRSGNDVFERVSGHPLEALVGTAHNVIRHPDMPRAVFAAMWHYLGRGEALAAYVKNISADGAYYWVMALVVPLDDGYLSVRLKPSGPLLAAAQRIYADVRETERRVEGDDPRRRRDAIAAGTQRLQELLSAAGYPDYTAFMHEALSSEVARHEPGAHAVSASDDDGTLHDAAEASRDADLALGRMVADLERYEQLTVELRRKSQFVFDLAEDIKLFALNAVLSAARLEGEGAALAAVADILGRRSGESEADIMRLNRHLGTATAQLSAMRFRIAGSKLMAEMVRVFLDDLRATGAEAESRAIELRALSAALGGAADEMTAAVDAFAAHLEHVEADVHAVDAHLRAVRALEMNGRIEGARLGDGVVIDLFTVIGRQITEARDQLQGFQALREAAGGPQTRRDAEETAASVVRAADLVLALSETGPVALAA